MGRKALGRGLEALIPPEAQEEAFEIEVERISLNPYRLRGDLAPETLASLISSVRERGVIQPVVVRRRGGGYELICGERRLLAAREAGMERVPAVVREASDREVLELALIENLQRENLDPTEEARAYSQLAQEFNVTQEEIARRVGKDRSTIANSLRLLNLPEQIQGYLSRGELTPGHARALLSLRSESLQLQLGEQIRRRHLSVREAERLVKRRKEQKLPRERDPSIVALEEELARKFGTRVRITRGRGGKGRLQIEFYSDSDLERILELVGVNLE